MSWSGGKDSAMALHHVLNKKSYDIAGLLTTVTEDYDRISMHGVRGILLHRQSKALGFPLTEVLITKDASNKAYETSMRNVLLESKKRDIHRVCFGDIFLEDLKKYRKEKLSQIGMKGCFPLWAKDTKELAKSFIAWGFKALVTCVDSNVLDVSFAGKLFDEEFLSRLPTHVDPCGENGEFHSFVFDGPIFRKRVELSVGEVVLRDSFYFCDLLPQ